jgi:hypothetical protein
MLRQLTHLTLDASADAGFALRITPDAAQTPSLGAIQHLDGADIRLGRPRTQQSHAGGIPDHHCRSRLCPKRSPQPLRCARAVFDLVSRLRPDCLDFRGFAAKPRRRRQSPEYSFVWRRPAYCGVFRFTESGFSGPIVCEGAEVKVTRIAKSSSTRTKPPCISLWRFIPRRRIHEILADE